MSNEYSFEEVQDKYCEMLKKEGKKYCYICFDVNNLKQIYLDKHICEDCKYVQSMVNENKNMG